jgi:DNA (cytosine-5)-methyltransferase 1
LRPKLLDLFCGAGGCARGYQLAGWHVTGVDIHAQPRYAGDVFVQADALEYLRDHGHEYDCIHASPPCQAYSKCRNMVWVRGRDYPDLVPATLAALEATGKPWVIENVPGAPLPYAVVLCGTQFGLPLRRHRLFGASFFLFSPSEPCRHRIGDLTISGHRIGLLGTRAKAYACADGSTRHRRIGATASVARAALGIDWMTCAEMMQAIPPAFSEFVGRQLFAIVTSAERQAS